MEESDLTGIDSPEDPEFTLWFDSVVPFPKRIKKEDQLMRTRQYSAIGEQKPVAKEKEPWDCRREEAWDRRQLREKKLKALQRKQHKKGIYFNITRESNPRTGDYNQ